ncbi:LamG-like jellyroll fold domain-containing protein [Pseudoruegeria sp. HB172150]|uniref:LamG-like jellyroll fold domain-containing protein n=1 Tax=Pseudoruegeria sp. HB172150 TaxID=2721164 RepID=UPI0015540A10|nr:LamG-like jellyroll fold domain-containing protein [Pseudoruegeria sp. HB172150]
MANITVSNSAELKSALSSAKAGDTILLESGNYGDVDLENLNFSDYVTITSADGANGAVFDSLTVVDSSYLRIDGVHVDSDSGRAGIWVSGSDHLEIVNSEINGPLDDAGAMDELRFGIEVRDGSHDIVIENNYVHHAMNGIANFGTSDFEIIGNNVNYIGSDAFKFAGVENGLIKNNIGPTHFYPYDDAHADFMQFQGEPSHNIEIIGNVLLLENRTDMQGIYFGGVGGHSDIVIEQNIIYTHMNNGIYIVDGVGSTITISHNTLINSMTGRQEVTRITAPSGSTIEYNIMSMKSGELDGKNLEMQFTDESGAYHYDDLFANADTTDGITLEDLVPVEGSMAESYGAYERLMELLNGETTDTGSETKEPTTTEPEEETTTDPEEEETASAPDEAETPSEPEEEEETPVTEPEEETPTETEEEEEASVDPEGVVFSLNGTYDIASTSDVIELEHSEEFELSEGTIALTFNADTVSGKQGIISKDAYGDGDHFSAYIRNGNLFVRFQNSDGTEEQIRVRGIQANTDYDLQISFGDGAVSVMLNGEVVGEAAFDMDFASNSEFLQIGANGWGSDSGEGGYEQVFNGTISDLMFVDSVVSYEEMQALLAGETAETSEPEEVDETETDTGSETDTGTETPSETEEETATDTPEETGTDEEVSQPETAEEMVFSLLGDHEFSGSADVVELAHFKDLELSEATIMLTFNADTVSGKHGIISKDAYGDGDHFTAYIRNGNLFVRFQDGETSEEFKVRHIEANKDYDLQITFGDGKVTAMLDGEVIGESAFDMTWEDNDEYLQIGANGWASDSGEAGYDQVFDGTISDVAIFDEVITTADHDYYFS